MSKLEYNMQNVAQTIGLDVSIIKNLVKMFLRTLPDEVKNIAEAVEKHDLPAVHSAGHRLKGSALNLGFSQIAESCRIIESSARNNEDIDYNKALSDIKNDAEDIISWFKSI